MMATLAFVCGSCRTAQAAPWGSRGRAGCCGGCGATVRIPDSALEFPGEEESTDHAPSAMEMMAGGGETNSVSGSPRPRKANSQMAFLLLLCLAPALVSSMAVNVYLAMQLRTMVARQSNK